MKAIHLILFCCTRILAMLSVVSLMTIADEGKAQSCSGVSAQIQSMSAGNTTNKVGWTIGGTGTGCADSVPPTYYLSITVNTTQTYYDSSWTGNSSGSETLGGITSGTVTDEASDGSCSANFYATWDSEVLADDDGYFPPIDLDGNGWDDPDCAESSFIWYYGTPTWTSDCEVNSYTEVDTDTGYYYTYDLELSTPYTDSLLYSTLVAGIPAYSGGLPPGNGTASYSLDSNHYTATGTKMEYRFAVSSCLPNQSYLVQWYQVTTYPNGTTSAQNMEEEVSSSGDPTVPAYTSVREVDVPSQPSSITETGATVTQENAGNPGD
jgi:hypothetical protein